MNEAKKVKLLEICDTLQWLSKRLSDAVNGSGEDAALVRCFSREWCGMMAIGPTVLMSDIEDLMADAEAWSVEREKQDRKELEIVMQSERT